MKGYWESLRPFEKRVVVGVGTLLFAIINIWFVFPHFSDWDEMKVRMAKAQHKLEVFQAEIAQSASYQTQVNKLQREGLDVPAEDQALQFSRTITDEEMRSGVTPLQGGRSVTRTNMFFLEQTQTVNVQGGEQQVVDFLYNLGSGNSLIRVRDLALHPDPQHQQIAATVKLVASFQKNPSKATPAPSKTGRLSGAASDASRADNQVSPPSFNPPPQPGKKTTK
jgi:hypothetical protein